MRVNSLLLMAFVAVVLACFVHPALGFFVLFLSHILCCHSALSSHFQNEELWESGNEGKSNSMQYEGDISKLFSGAVNCSNSPESTRSYSERQLETFNHRHGLLILHLLAALMFVPSLVAWLQRNDICQNFPSFWDSLLGTGVILHADSIMNSMPFTRFAIVFSLFSKATMNIAIYYRKHHMKTEPEPGPGPGPLYGLSQLEKQEIEARKNIILLLNSFSLWNIASIQFKGIMGIHGVLLSLVSLVLALSDEWIASTFLQWNAWDSLCKEITKCFHLQWIGTISTGLQGGLKWIFLFSVQYVLLAKTHRSISGTIYTDFFTSVTTGLDIVSATISIPDASYF